MPALYLSENDVTHLVGPDDAYEALESAFASWGTGQAENVPRRRAQAPGIVLHAMSAAAGYLGYVGWKCYTTTKGGARFWVGLADASSGALLALIAADQLGRLRTGAATAVAVARLTPPDVDELGLLGTGFQAEGQLQAVAQVRRLARAFVYSRSVERRQAFAQAMSERLRLEVIPVDRPAEAVSDLPLVITATNSRAPVVAGADLEEGATLCAVGSNWWNRAELDADCLRRADVVVCDSVEACQLEAGDFREPLERGHFHWSQAVDLADVVAGQRPGRSRRDQLVIFKSVGLALEDVALAAVVFERARTQGRGELLPF